MKHLAEQFVMAMPAEDLRFPLASVDFVRDGMDISHTEALAYVDEMDWVWDISSEQAERRTELRVFKKCAYDLMRGRVGAIYTENEVYNQIVPSHLGKIKAASIARKLSCQPEHVHRLIREGSLIAVTATSVGIQGSPEVMRDSLITFLKSRRLQ